MKWRVVLERDEESAREIERLLLRYGFVLISQRGSHRKWRNLSTGRKVCRAVPQWKVYFNWNASKYS